MMKEYLRKLPKEIFNLIDLSRNIAEDKNMSAYLVGGFVRDLMLGVKNYDLDIVVEGNGIAFAESLSVALKSKLIRHRRFGTATVLINPDLKIDIASARKEFYPHPAHLPVVEKSSLKDDHFRRDFTINAMAISITGKNFGRLIDFFGGEKDLKNKNIRILHDLSFMDDPTRILRAIRFEKRYDFKIEPKTLNYLRQAAKHKMPEKVEPQRIRDELILILKEDKPIRQIKRMGELIGFDFISKRLSVNKNTYKFLKKAQNAINWFEKTQIRHRKIDSWVIHFIALIDSLDKKETRKMCFRFSFNKGVVKRILSFKDINRRFILSLCRRKIKPSKIYALLHPLSFEVILSVKAKYKSPQIQKHINGYFEFYNNIRLSITGDDLQKLGIKPGPDYQKIFKKILNAKLDGLINTREEELNLARMR